MDIEAVRELNRANLSQDAPAREAALARMGNPSLAEQVRLAVQGLDDPDRNVRLQMVRWLSYHLGEGVADGMLKALSDPARRVRRMAARLCTAVAGDPRVEGRLREIVEDEGEITKIRAAAFLSLSNGSFLATLARAPEEARRYFDDASSLSRFRSAALGALVALDPLPEEARELLREIVESGSKEEAVRATRALCGFKVVNLAVYSDPEERKRVARECDLAGGRAWFWVPRERDGGEGATAAS